MNFKRWNSIRTLGHDEFINEAQDQVIATEKLDGMNVSVTKEYVAGRNGELKASNLGYRGWAQEGSRLQMHELTDKYVFFGEWLVFHTVEYKEECLNKFYLFSAIEKGTEKEVSFEVLQELAKELKVETPRILFRGLYSEFLKNKDSLVGLSSLTKKENKGEGLVLFNVSKGFRTKIVTEEFKEVHKVVYAGGKLARRENSELWAEAHATESRTNKIMHKLVDEEILRDSDFTFNQLNKTKEIVIPYLFEDMLTESTEFPEGFIREAALGTTKRIATEFIKKKIMVDC